MAAIDVGVESPTASYLTVETEFSLPRLVAEQLLALLGAPASDVDGYERFEPVDPVFVALDPAATSPLMDR